MRAIMDPHIKESNSVPPSNRELCNIRLAAIWEILVSLFRDDGIYGQNSQFVTAHRPHFVFETERGLEDSNERLAVVLHVRELSKGNKNSDIEWYLRHMGKY